MCTAMLVSFRVPFAGTTGVRFGSSPYTVPCVDAKHTVMPTANATRAKDEKHERQETDSFFTTAFISYWRLKKGHLLSCQVSNCVTTCDVHFVTRGRVLFVDGRKWPSQKVRKQTLHRRACVESELKRRCLERLQTSGSRLGQSKGDQGASKSSPRDRHAVIGLLL